MKTYPLFFCLMGSLFSLLLSNAAVAQQIPVNFPLIYENLRRQQVMGELNGDLSFHYQPVNTQKAFGKNPGFMFDSLFFDPKPNGNSKSKLIVEPLPLQLNTVYNSSHPYGWGDGAMVPAKGIQTLLTGGVYAQYGVLSLQLSPQFHYAQNLPFEEYPKDAPDAFFRRLNRTVRYLDTPVRHSNQSISQVLPGNSSIRVNYGAFSAGLSTENIWWGPGRYNALLFSDNAQGFLHATLNTTKPAKTFMGNFEGQYFAGRLQSSGFNHYSDGAYTNIFVPYNEDSWRYLTGISISYSPKWIPELFLGFTRSFMMYREDMNDGFNSYFPFFEGLQKENVGLIESRESRTDQHVSVFARWFLKPIQSELYFEFMRTDHPLNWRDFVLNPEHSRGYILGFSKYFKLDTKNILQVHLEMTQTQNPVNNLVRWGNAGTDFHAGLGLYENFQVRHGLTNRGQILGSGLGASGNLTKIEVSKIQGLNKIGITLERLERHANFYNYAKANGLDQMRPWVDLSLGALVDQQYQNLLFSFKIQAVRSNNYNWYVPVENINTFGLNGVKKFNLHSDLKVAYLFW